jgi:hypothetical protein
LKKNLVFSGYNFFSSFVSNPKKELRSLLNLAGMGFDFSLQKEKKRDHSGFKDDSYLVDPASSHMLVSKIKPCMSKYKQLYTVKLRMAH